MPKQRSEKVSAKTYEQRERAKFIKHTGILAVISCAACVAAKVDCWVVEGKAVQKCSHCTDGGRSKCNAMSGMFLYFYNKVFVKTNFA